MPNKCYICNAGEDANCWIVIKTAKGLVLTFCSVCVTMNNLDDLENILIGLMATISDGPETVQ